MLRDRTTYRKISLINRVAAMAIAIVALACAAARAGTPEIHERWAPVIMQAAVTPADFITRADFDGDWTGDNNWENFPDYPRPAFVYYDVRSTETHWFIYYSLFHPRDYTTDPECPSSCHENDLESIQLTVRKDGTAYGRLEFLQTLHHSEITLYTNDETEGGAMEVSGPVTTKKGRPVVYVEEYGHGIYGTPGESMFANPMITDTVMYVYKGKAEEPAGIPAEAVGYDLLPIYDTFWAHRDCRGKGKCFNGSFTYRGADLPSCMDGDTYGICAASLPWGYGQATGGDVVQGDWFFDPAKAILYHAGPIKNFATTYTFNPYEADIIETAAETR